MSDPSPQAAETTPEGTTPLPTSVETSSVSAPAADTFETFEARENAAATGVEWKEPGMVTPTTPESDTAAAATTTTADAATTPPSPTSKRTERRTQRDQEQINETIRRAVQDATEATERRLRAELAKPAATATPEPAAASTGDPKDPEPLESDFEDYRQFVKATAKWEIRQAKREADADAAAASAKTAETSAREAFQAKAQTWIGRRDTFVAANPTKAATLTDFLDTVHAGTPIGDTIMESEVGAEIADYLAINPAEAERIARLGPIAALRALGRIEARFDTTDTTTSASATTAGPAAKTVTTAPAPPMTLASRSATPADPSAAALARGDFEAWEAEENRKAIAANR